MVNIRRLFSVTKPGPLGTTWAVIPAAGLGRRHTAQRVLEHLVGLAEPVGGEHRVERRDDGALDPGGQLDPRAARLLVLGLVVGRLDHVLRAGERDACRRRRGSCGGCAGRGGGSFPCSGAIGSIRCHSIFVSRSRASVCLYAGMPRDPRWSNSIRTGTPRLGGADQRREEPVGRLVPGGDVELHVHELLGRVHGRCHRGDRLDVVGKQLRRVPGDGGKGTQLPVEVGHRGHVGQVRRHLGRARRLCAVRRWISSLTRSWVCRRLVRRGRCRTSGRPAVRTTARRARGSATPSLSTDGGSRE